MGHVATRQARASRRVTPRLALELVAGASPPRVRERLERKKWRTSTPKGHEEAGAGRASVPGGHEEVGAEASDKRLALKLAMDEGARTGTAMLVLELTTDERARTGTATPVLSLAWPKITINQAGQFYGLP